MDSMKVQNVGPLEKKNVMIIFPLLQLQGLGRLQGMHNYQLCCKRPAL